MCLYMRYARRRSSSVCFHPKFPLQSRLRYTESSCSQVVDAGTAPNASHGLVISDRLYYSLFFFFFFVLGFFVAEDEVAEHSRMRACCQKRDRSVISSRPIGFEWD